MKRILLSILLTIVATGANAQFRASINMKPDFSQGDYYVATFNYASVCRQLEVDPDKFFYTLAYGQNSQNPEYTVHILTDGPESNPENYVSCNLTLDGKVAKSEEEAKWHCQCPFLPESNQIRFTVSPAGQLGEGGYIPVLKEGDVCHAVFALEYEGRIATFDITVNVTDDYGPLVPLDSMEKVGETVLSGKGYNEYGYQIDFYHRFDTDEIASLFGGDVKGSNLQLYLMADPERQTVFNASSYLSATALSLEGSLKQDNTPSPSYDIAYSMNGEMRLCAFADYFKASQKTSGSVFLVADGKYYEVIMDIQFGDEFDEKEDLDIVATVHEDVQLMWTQSYYTYQHTVTGRWGLVSTETDSDWIEELLGTDTPALYAEKREQDGRVIYSNRYTAAPGQGFWLRNDGGHCYWNLWSSQNSLGVYYMDGALMWYEQPSDDVLPGNTYQLNLYLANSDNGKAVKYEINVEIVEELQTESVAYVRSLPASLTGGTPDGIESPTPSPSLGKGTIYDLQGRRLQKAPEKGMYIQDGVLRKK